MTNTHKIKVQNKVKTDLCYSGTTILKRKRKHQDPMY